MGRSGVSAVAALGVVALVGLVVGCATAVSSPGLSAAPTVSTSAEPTATAVSTPSGSSPSAMRTFPPSQTPIEPGTYRWTGFAPTITLVVGPGWGVGHRHPEFFDLFRGGDFPAVSFGRFKEIYADATSVVAVTDAEAVVAALRTRADLTLSPAEAVDLGGLSGVQFDLTSSVVQAPLFRGPTGSLRMDPGFENRYRLLDVPGGGVLLVGINARAGGLDAAVTLAEPILATIAVEP